MASINAHRKRQVYGNHLYRGGYGYHNGGAPVGASTMTPSGDIRADDFSAKNRKFADMWDILNRKFLGTTLKQVSHYSPTQYTRHMDVIRTSPASMLNVDNPNNVNRRVARPAGPILAYTSDISGASGYLNYSRRSTGILRHSYPRHKVVTKGGGYKQVIDIAYEIGGNIKSRGILLKWTAGMWRAK